MNQQPIILFDGVCNYCNAVINFVIRQDKRQVFRFAAMQSAAGRAYLRQYGLPENLDSFVLVDQGKALLRSEAALQVIAKLPWYLSWIRFFRLVPRRLRDRIYDLVARNRYKWFGKRKVCMVPSAEVRTRFLPEPPTE